MIPSDNLAESFLAREVGHRILATLQDVADVPANVLVDALMAVSVAFVTAAELDEDEIAENWRRTVKESKKRNWKV
jgi:hypothetical protein